MGSGGERKVSMLAGSSRSGRNCLLGYGSLGLVHAAAPSFFAPFLASCRYFSRRRSGLPVSSPSFPLPLQQGKQQCVPPPALEIFVTAKAPFLRETQPLQYPGRGCIVRNAPGRQAFQPQVPEPETYQRLCGFSGISLPPEFRRQLVTYVRFPAVVRFAPDAAVSDKVPQS